MHEHPQQNHMLWRWSCETFPITSQQKVFKQWNIIIQYNKTTIVTLMSIMNNKETNNKSDDDSDEEPFNFK